MSFEYLKDLEKAEIQRRNGLLSDISTKALINTIDFVKHPEEHVNKCKDCNSFNDYMDGCGWCDFWNCQVRKQFYCGNFSVD